MHISSCPPKGSVIPFYMGKADDLTSQRKKIASVCGLLTVNVCAVWQTQLKVSSKGVNYAHLDLALKTGISLTWNWDKAAEHKSYHSHSRLEFPQALARIRWLPDASYSLSFWLVSQENCSLSQFCLKVDCPWTLTLILLNTGLNRKDKSILHWLIALFFGSKHGLKTWLQLSMAQTFSWKQHLSWKLHFGAFSVYDTSHLPRTRGFHRPQLWVTVKAELGNVHWPINLCPVWKPLSALRKQTSPRSRN